MANTTTTEITSMISNFAEKVLLSRAYPHFVHALWAQVKDIPSKNSPTIKFRRYGNLTAATTALTEGVDPTGSQLSKSDISTNVYQYGKRNCRSKIFSNFTIPIFNSSLIMGLQ